MAICARRSPKKPLSPTSPGPGVNSLRVLVISFFPVYLHQLHVCQAEEVEGVLVNAVLLVIDDAHHTRVDQHLGALDAWEVGHIAGGPFGTHPMQGSLNNGIRFRLT